MSFLSVAEVEAGLGIMNADPNIYDDAPDHHIGEITQLGTDGRRYIFGLPAYNTYQEEVSMAVGDDLGADDGFFSESNAYSGLVNLGGDFSSAASTDNKWGIDHMHTLIYLQRF
jgi:hypothetical protein